MTRSQAPSDGEAPATFDIFVLGTRSSGKSVLLASLYRQLSSMDGVTNFFARCDDPEQHRELCDNYDQLLDTEAEWPAGSYRVDSYDMSCFHRLRGRSLPVFSIRFHDYPGGYVSDQIERREFIEARAEHCNSVMALIDGRKLLDRLEDREANPAHSLHKDLDGLVRVLQQCVGKPIHFVLTKADLLAPAKYPLKDIVAELKRHKGFGHILAQQIDAGASCFLVPASAIGPNFAWLDPADDLIKKRRNGTIEPYNLEVMTSVSMVDTVLDLARIAEGPAAEPDAGPRPLAKRLKDKLGNKLGYARMAAPAALPVFGPLGVLGIIGISAVSERFIANKSRSFEDKVREIRLDITDQASALEAILKIQYQLAERFVRRFPAARLGARFDPAAHFVPHFNASDAGSAAGAGPSPAQQRGAPTSTGDRLPMPIKVFAACYLGQASLFAAFPIGSLWEGLGVVAVFAAIVWAICKRASRVGKWAAVVLTLLSLWVMAGLTSRILTAISAGELTPLVRITQLALQLVAVTCLFLAQSRDWFATANRAKVTGSPASKQAGPPFDSGPDVLSRDHIAISYFLAPASWLKRLFNRQGDPLAVRTPLLLTGRSGVELVFPKRRRIPIGIATVAAFGLAWLAIAPDKNTKTASPETLEAKFTRLKGNAREVEPGLWIAITESNGSIPVRSGDMVVTTIDFLYLDGPSLNDNWVDRPAIAGRFPFGAKLLDGMRYGDQARVYIDADLVELDERSAFPSLNLRKGSKIQATLRLAPCVDSGWEELSNSILRVPCMGGAWDASFSDGLDGEFNGTLKVRNDAAVSGRLTLRHSADDPHHEEGEIVEECSIKILRDVNLNCRILGTAPLDYAGDQFVLQIVAPGVLAGSVSNGESVAHATFAITERPGSPGPLRAIGGADHVARDYLTSMAEFAR